MIRRHELNTILSTGSQKRRFLKDSCFLLLCDFPINIMCLCVCVPVYVFPSVCCSRCMCCTVGKAHSDSHTHTHSDRVVEYRNMATHIVNLVIFSIWCLTISKISVLRFSIRCSCKCFVSIGNLTPKKPNPNLNPRSSYQSN